MNTISLDFGTTNSQIAYKDKAGIIRSIEVDEDSKIPTSIYYSPADRRFFFGQKAELAYADACADAVDAGNDFSRYSKIISRFQSHFKPMLTKAEVKPEALSPLFGEDEQYPLTWLRMLTAFFSHFKEVAEQTVFMGERVECLRLTHPVHFPSTQLYKAAAFEAGFSCIELVAEPEAAHAAYAHSDMIPADNALIFDMGGGTLDVCLLCKHGETWQVEHEPLRLDTAGYHIDLALARELLPDINKFLKDELKADSPARRFLPYTCDTTLLQHIRQTLKEPLGAGHSGKVRFRYDLDRYDDLTFRLKDYTGAHLEQLVAQVMQPSFERLQRYVRELPVQPDCILMVGGSSRMLCIQEKLKALFPSTPVYTPNGGDKAVAEGALRTEHLTDRSIAIRYYAEQGDASAQCSLGYMYENGEGVAQDYAEAVNWYRKAAEQGLAEAQLNLGYMYAIGKGIPQNYHEAVKWYHKAAEQGEPLAQLCLGHCYHDGNGVTQDCTEAFKWFQLAAEQGIEEAQYYLGLCYETGMGIPTDFREALKWYYLAAEQGNAAAQNKLGECYYDGKGVTQDYAEAFKWFQLAAAQEQGIAQYYLGLCYYYGRGIVKNVKDAVMWFLKAAEQEDLFYTLGSEQLSDCYYHLGLCYAKGIGVAKDKGKARFWLWKACKQGHKEAEDALSDLNSSFWDWFGFGNSELSTTVDEDPHFWTNYP